MAAAILLALRDSGAGRRACGDRVSLGVHDLDEPQRMEGRFAHDLRRPRQLLATAAGSPLRRIGGHTLVYTALSVLLPLMFGTFAAVVFHANFPGRGVLRGIFIMPMMATPVAIALVWTMMFHPQLGVLNYLLSLVGMPPQLWVFHPATVIPSLVLVETWQWTPLVMLIVLGGLAAIPTEPYESAQIDGANLWQMFRYITLPLVMPFLFIAAMIRMIDAVKSFDIIFAITQGGPGSASETINLYLYSVAFSYYDLGYGSAIAVMLFLLIVALAALAALSAPARDVDRDRSRRMSLRAVLGRVGLWFSVDHHRLAGDPVLPLDAVAVGEVRGRQRGLSAGLHPGTLCLEELRRRARVQSLPDLLHQLADRDGHGDLAGDAGGRPAGYGIARMAARKSAVVILIARITPGLSYLIPLFSCSSGSDCSARWAADHHSPRGHRADRDLDHDRLFRDDAAGTGGGRADRWRDAMAGLSPRGAADRQPGLAVAFILAVIFSWNNFVFGIVLAGRETRTLPVAVYNMISFDQLSWGPLAAAALIVTFPVLLLTVFAQRQIVAGLTAGAVKGG